VDVVTGRVFTAPTVDLQLPGPLALSFVRSYDVRARERDVGLGFGWAHSLAWTLEVRRRGCVVLSPDLRELEFGRIPQGAGVLGPNRWILHREGGLLALDEPGGARRVFEPDPGDATGRRHRLIAIEDRYKNRIRLEHDGRRLARVHDAVGRVVHLFPAPDGRIGRLEVAGAGGAGRFSFARYEYDQGQLVMSCDADGFATHYRYDDGGAHLLVSTERPTGLVFFYRYDSRERCVETWGERPGRAETCLAESVSPLLGDGVTRAKGIHHVVLEYLDDGYTEAIDPDTVHRYAGNAHGKVDTAVVAGSVYTRTYDPNGQMTSFTDPLGATTTYERDMFGHLTRIVDPLGRETIIARHPGGEIREVVDAGGGVTAVDVHQTGLHWVDPLGATFEVSYDERGLPARAVAPDGRVLTYRHDPQGNAVEVWVEGQLQARAEHDALGRCVRRYDAAGHATAYSYTPSGLLSGIWRADGSTWQYEHDGDGKVVAIVDPLGRTTRTLRGGTGSLTDIVRPDGTTVRMRYDRLERLVEVHNARGDVCSFQHDTLGMRAVQTTFDGRVLRNRFDAGGRRISTTFDGGARVDIERDVAGQVVKQTYDDGSEETFEYDARGMVIRASNAAGSFELRRNALGWIIGEVQVVDDESFSIDVEHDLLGNRVRRQTTWGHQIRWTRDRRTQTTRVELDGDEAVIVRRDSMGREIERLLPRGARIESAFDPVGRLEARRVHAPAAAESSGLQPAWVGKRAPGVTVASRFAYDPASRLAEVEDDELGTRRFEYSPIGELVGVVAERGQEERFRYDASGNLHEASHGAPTREYAAGDRLLRRGDTTLRWDERGRLIERRTPRQGSDDEVERYVWSSSGMLVEVHRRDTIVRMAYDPFARRVKKDLWRRTEGGAQQRIRSTRFCWDGSELVHERITDAAGSRDRTYFFEPDGSPWAHRDSRGEWVHYVNDAIGTPDRLVDGAGRVVAAPRLDAWGRAGDASGTSIRLLGQYADEETGLHYNRHRHFDPVLRRYISPDPLEIDGDLNAYRYALNCPTSVADPLGLIYSQITRPDGSIVYSGTNPDEGGNRPPPPHLSDKPCAEAQALGDMARDVRAQVDAEQKNTKLEERLQGADLDAEVEKRMKQRFEDEDLKLETFHSSDPESERADPCSRCQVMIAKLGIEDRVVGAKGEQGKFGTYAPERKGGKGGKGKRR
jgi:RHS repeat-associated protein